MDREKTIEALVGRSGQSCIREYVEAAYDAGAASVAHILTPRPSDAERELYRLREALRGEAAQLDTWAHESQTGGWSTHQVQPMRTRAEHLRRLAEGAAR